MSEAVGRRTAVVLGGSGAVGRAVVRALAAEGLAVRFTFHAGEAVAAELARAHGARAVPADFTDPASLEAAIEALREGAAPDVLIGCAGGIPAPSFLLGDAGEDARLAAIGLEGFRRTLRALAPAMIARGEGDVVAVGGLSRGQSLPVPAAWASVQGALSALVMALAKELGPHGVRVNMVALGPLEDGLARHLAPETIADYLRFSCLRRLGRVDEAAAAIAWLALRNRYVAGEVLPVNGGV